MLCSTAVDEVLHKILIPYERGVHSLPRSLVSKLCLKDFCLFRNSAIKCWVPAYSRQIWPLGPGQLHRRQVQVRGRRPRQSQTRRNGSGMAFIPSIRILISSPVSTCQEWFVEKCIVLDRYGWFFTYALIDTPTKRCVILLRNRIFRTIYWIWPFFLL